MSHTATRPDYIIPTPQFARYDTTIPLGTAVLEGEADQWAATRIRNGLREKGVSEPVSTPRAGADTRIVLTTERDVLERSLTECRREFGGECATERLGREGYVLHVRTDEATKVVTIAARDGAGLAYGADSFLQLVTASENGPVLRPALLFDYPAIPVRMYSSSRSLDGMAGMRFNMRGGGGTAAEIAEMRLRHIEPYANIHPSHAYAGQPGLRYSDPFAVDQALAPLVAAVERGVKWVGMNFDDIDLRLGHAEDREKYGSIGKAHVAFVNDALERLRAVSPECTLAIIPIIYGSNWLPGTWVYAVNEAENYDYLETLGRDVDPSVVFIWTGESVESINMTDDDIDQWLSIVRHPTMVFENTPTGDLTDFGALRYRSPNIGGKLLGWIYISRGVQAQVAELSTAEYLWNPKAYDPAAARTRAINRLVGPDAAPEMERLVAAFSADERDGVKDRRYRHPLWREGRLLEVVEPNDSEIADYYVGRLQAISKAVPALDSLIWQDAFYQAIRKAALASVELAQTYLETYTMIQFAERGDVAQALAAGDRAEALFEEWNCSSSGTTDLNAPSERRDAMNYVENVGVARRLRALRRGDDDPILWTTPATWESTGEAASRFGRECVRLSNPGENVRMRFSAALGSLKWMLATVSGEADAAISVVVNGDRIAIPDGSWDPSRWKTIAVPLPPGKSRYEVTISLRLGAEWAIARAALIEDPPTTKLLHATRSSAALGPTTRLTNPTRMVVEAETPHVKGKLAVRTDLDFRRGASGDFLDFTNIRSVGQTFHLPAVGEITTIPHDPIRLLVRESSDGDALSGIGVLFQQQGPGPLRLVLYRWEGDVERTTRDPGAFIASTDGHAGTPYGDSRHWVFFPISAELDPGETYYFELTAPEGWIGWRLHQSYGWYGERNDPLRSAYTDGDIRAGADIPFRTYVQDVYAAEWKRSES